MLHRIFSVYDTKSEAYLQPFFMSTSGQAIRAITDCANDPNHQFGRHPADYTLFDLGQFDDNHATWDLKETPVALVKCLELLDRADTVEPLFKAMEG